MNGRRWFGGVVLVAALLLVALTVARPAWAVDCKGLAEEIKKERSLVKKKERLAEAVKVCPNSSEINYSYGYALERLRDYEQAVTYYRKAIGLDSRSAAALFGLGDVYAILGDNRAAVEAYERGLKLAPQDRRAKKSLEAARAQARAATGKQEPAAEAPKVAASAGGVKPPPAVPTPAPKAVAEAKPGPPVDKPVPSPTRIVAATPPSGPVSESPDLEKTEDGDKVQAVAQKAERLPVLEPRVVKRPVARAALAVAAPSPPPAETGQPGGAETPIVEAAPAPRAGAGQSLPAAILDIQPGRQVDPRALRFDARDQVAEFSLVLTQEAAGRKRLALPEMRGGISLADFKKIQDSRRQEIANSAKIDALPVDPERPIIPYFKEKRLATPQEPAR